jgi:hypothetical protein
LIAASFASAETVKVKFTVSAGKLDRKNEPVRVPLQLPEKLFVESVKLLDEKGKPFAIAQVSAPSLLTRSIQPEKGKVRRDLLFVLPALKAEASTTLEAVIEGVSADDSYRGRDVESAEIGFGKRHVLLYEAPKLDDSSPAAREKTFKPFHHVYDPSGKFLVTKGVGGLYTHHRGIFYGFMKCTYGKDTIDIWHCKGDTHQAVTGTGFDFGPRSVANGTLSTINWNGVGKKTFAVEKREVIAYNVPGGNLIDFTSELTPTGEDVKLDGDPQHAGFHFRASNEVAERQAAYEKAMKIKDADEREEALKKVAVKDLTIFIRPDGEGKPGTEVNWDGKKNTKHKDLPWLAMSFVVKGKRFTVAYLDQPTNPKEARFSERAYGRFGSYFVKTVKKDEPLVVRYRLWLQEGKMKPEEVAALSKAFVEPVTVKVK